MCVCVWTIITTQAMRHRIQIACTTHTLFRIHPKTAHTHTHTDVYDRKWIVFNEETNKRNERAQRRILLSHVVVVFGWTPFRWFRCLLLLTAAGIHHTHPPTHTHWQLMLSICSCRLHIPLAIHFVLEYCFPITSGCSIQKQQSHAKLADKSVN